MAERNCGEITPVIGSEGTEFPKLCLGSLWENREAGARRKGHRCRACVLKIPTVTRRVPATLTTVILDYYKCALCPGLPRAKPGVWDGARAGTRASAPGAMSSPGEQHGREGRLRAGPVGLLPWLATHSYSYGALSKPKAQAQRPPDAPGWATHTPPPRTLPPRPEPAFQNARLIPRSAGRSAVAPLKSSAPAEAPRLPLRKAHLDRAPPAQAAGPSAHCALRSTR